MCSHCVTYSQQLVPGFHRDWSQIQADLEEAYPGYFRHFSKNSAYEDAAEEATAALRYVSTHQERFRQERASSGRDLLQVSFTEAPAEQKLRGHCALLRSYVWHKLSASRQHAALDSLMTAAGLPLKDSLIIADYREKIRLPFAPIETGQMWHAQQKWAITCLGIVLIRHSVKSTAARPDLERVYAMYLTEVREQVAETSNKLLTEFMKEVKVSTEGNIHLFTDCGPHFRASECLHHSMYKVAAARNQTLHVSFLAEQHGKSIIDSLFGVTGLIKGGWLGDWARTRPVHTVGDLEKALQRGAARTMKADPEGPRWICRVVSLGTHRDRIAHFVQCAAMKLTRTYCLTIKPPARARKNPMLYNRVFTDNPHLGTALDYCVVEENRGDLKWKLSYFEGERQWEAAPPEPGDETTLCRRRRDQQAILPPRPVKALRTFEERVAAKLRRAARGRARAARKARAAEGSDCCSSDSSSSSSSSSSS